MALVLSHLRRLTRTVNDAQHSSFHELCLGQPWLCWRMASQSDSILLFKQQYVCDPLNKRIPIFTLAVSVNCNTSVRNGKPKRSLRQSQPCHSLSYVHLHHWKNSSDGLHGYSVHLSVQYHQVTTETKTQISLTLSLNFTCIEHYSTAINR